MDGRDQRRYENNHSRDFNGGFQRGNSVRMDIPLDDLQKPPRKRHSRDDKAKPDRERRHSHKRKHKNHDRDRDLDALENELNSTYTLPDGKVESPKFSDLKEHHRRGSGASTGTFVVNDKQKLIDETGSRTTIRHLVEELHCRKVQSSVKDLRESLRANHGKDLMDEVSVII